MPLQPQVVIESYRITAQSPDSFLKENITFGLL